MQPTPSDTATTAPLDLIWGASAIGEAIQTDRRTVFYMLEKQLIPARKIGRKWVASRAALRQHFGQGA